jgi:ATP-dependent Clp protease, protease subunit
MKKRYQYKQASYRNEDTDDEDDEDEGTVNKLLEVRNNNIYFYDSINNQSTLNLNIALNKLIETHLIFAIQNDCEPIPIKLHLNSPGGEIVGAFCIVDTICASKVPIHTIIEGEVASAATLISVVGHKRFINKNAHMLIHQIRAGFFGKMDDCTDEMSNIRRYSKKLKKIYLKHTTLTEEKLEKMLKKEVFWGYKTCLKNGLVDEQI